MRILVSAASRHGSTAEIATALGAALRDRGALVDVVEPHDVGDVSGYDAVVIGSAVYRGRWLRPAKEFVDEHAAELRRRPVFLFSSGPIAEQDRPVNNPYDVSTVRHRTGANEHRMFAGKLDLDALSVGERMHVRMSGGRAGDFRDWDAVGGWAGAIVDAVSEAEAGFDAGAASDADAAVPPTVASEGGRSGGESRH
ncbi:flavodoxin domain-containing protein [Rhodococcus phenolicus]|uniref:flavodoxin domain-containing protein n=1 Tax=Rhodococcus phenolicus TaxID=263849 RepID=UPI0009EE3EF9|nr:flavodoxin domain-containing protein [Rhodococcus phenolicus]